MSTSSDSVCRPETGRGRRRFPWRLAWHLLREFLLPLFCTVVAFSALFLLRDVVDDITDFSGSGIPVRDLLAYFGVKLLLNLVNIIPISILLSVSFMTVMLGKNSELTAIRSAGLSLARCGTFIWIAAAISSILVFVTGEISAPLCARVLNRVQKQWIDKGHQHEADMHLEYANTADGRDWFFSEFSETGPCRGIKITEYGNVDGKRCVVRTISAREAEFSDGVWKMKQAEIFHMSYDNGLMMPEVTKYDEWCLETSETPRKILEHSKRIEDMNIYGLVSVIRDGRELGPKAVKEAWIRLWYRLTFPLASIVGALFGFSLSIAVGRAGVLKGFASSVGLLILFYLAGEFLRVWGLNGSLPAFLAGAASNLVFFVAGLVLLHRKR